MISQHALKSVTVAGIATVALALAQQARAESGEVWMERQESSTRVQTASAGASAPAAESAAQPAPAGGVALLARRTIRSAGDAVRAAAVRPLILRYSSENGLPYELADAVVRSESRYDAGARSGPHMGLTQINVRTAASLGYDGPSSGLLDAETNLRYGLKYLGQAYKLAGGDTCGTILRYQAGRRATTMTRHAPA